MIEQDPTGDDRALAVRGLTKRYGDKLAVAGIDLDIRRGSFFGLVGPNGAGKTTTLNMITGLVRPDTGAVWIDGIEMWHHPVEAKRRIGVLPDGFRLFERLTGPELLTYHGLLRGLAPDLVDERARQLLNTLDLESAGTTLVADYSHGMRKKVALAAALLHAPRLLFLDEPFEGIDPVSARTIRAVLERFTGHGGTVLFSSHVMDVVERLCDRIAILAAGRVVADGTLEAVRGQGTLEDAFVRIVGERVDTNDLSWLDTSPA